MRCFLRKFWDCIGSWMAMLVPIAIFIVSLIWGSVTMVSEFREFQKNKSADSYIEGYDEGYSEGYDEGVAIGWDYGYEEGSDEGWIDNIKEPANYLEYEAVHYAIDHSGWHPEEAWMLIEAYQKDKPFYEDGSPPSEQDYLDAIDSLIYFYDYFYSK